MTPAASCGGFLSKRIDHYMMFEYLAAVSPATGNTSATVYIIIGVVAAAAMIGAVIAGIISKKKKK